MPMIFKVAFTWCGLPSGCRSSTSALLCSEDQDGTASMSASTSRIASGEASTTTSRDARTATLANLILGPRARWLTRGLPADVVQGRGGLRPSADRPRGCAGKPRRRRHLLDAVVVDHGGTGPEVLVLRRLGPREYWRRAGIGAREDLSPLVTRLAREARCEDL